MPRHAMPCRYLQLLLRLNLLVVSFLPLHTVAQSQIYHAGILQVLDHCIGVLMRLGLAAQVSRDCCTVS